jgi:hypothetical protein
MVLPMLQQLGCLYATGKSNILFDVVRKRMTDEVVKLSLTCITDNHVEKKGSEVS